MLKHVRLSFPQIWRAVKVEGQPDSKPSFSANLLIAKDDKQVAEIEKAILAVATEQWGDKTRKTLEEVRGKDRTCLHDGAHKEYDGYDGCWYITARSQMKPLMLDRYKQPLTEADGRPYGGCYVNASIDVWAQDNQWGKRINATLRGLQFVADGEAFAAGPPATAEEFPEEEEEETPLA
jgi:hypothetical protein